MNIEDILGQFTDTGVSEASDDVTKLASMLTQNPELLDQLEAVVDYEDGLEKNAEFEKHAAELEFDGRLFGRGLIAEQTKVAYFLGQIDDEDAIKTAEALDMDVYDMLELEKDAGAQEEAFHAAQQDAAAGARQVEEGSHSASGPANSGELTSAASVASLIRKVKQHSTELPVNA